MRIDAKFQFPRGTHAFLRCHAQLLRDIPFISSRKTPRYVSDTFHEPNLAHPSPAESGFLFSVWKEQSLGFSSLPTYQHGRRIPRGNGATGGLHKSQKSSRYRDQEESRLAFMEIRVAVALIPPNWVHAGPMLNKDRISRVTEAIQTVIVAIRVGLGSPPPAGQTQVRPLGSQKTLHEPSTRPSMRANRRSAPLACRRIAMSGLK